MKIAFLFLIITDVYHQPCWRNFFNESVRKELYTIYVHSKDPIPADSFFKKYEIDTKVPTRWETTLEAQTELLREALKDPLNEKFVYLSESTIPLQPFDIVYERLMEDSRSQFFYEPNPHPERSFPPLAEHLIYKNTQWVTLNRKHAELMAQNNHILGAVTNQFIDNEHYHGTFIVNHELTHEVNKQDHTLVLWPVPSPHPHMFTDLNHDEHRQELVEAIINKRYLFCRKFDSNCDLTPLKQYMPELLHSP